MKRNGKEELNKVHREIECRFLEIDKGALIAKLHKFGAEDRGEITLEETIFYDHDLKWKEKETFLRIRNSGGNITVSYKEHTAHTVDGTLEIEFGIEDGNFQKAELLFEKVGLVAYRHQQKKRHTFLFDGVIVDIDTWPRIPPYVELEGDSEEVLKEVSTKLGFEWKDANFHNAGWLIEELYHIPVRKMKWFTFDRFE